MAGGHRTDPARWQVERLQGIWDEWRGRPANGSVGSPPGTGTTWAVRSLTRSASDADVLARVRHGDTGSYGILYERHVERAGRLARSIVNNRSRGRRRVGSVRLGAVRTGARQGSGRFVRPVPDEQCSQRELSRQLATWAASGGGWTARRARVRRATRPFASVDEVAVLRTAFESLAPRLRQVLWQTEVDELSHRDIAERTGSSPSAVAMLALRARQALGGAYLHAHLGVEPRRGQLSPGCREIRPQLAALVRNRLTPMRRARVEEHLASCPACRQAHDALGRLNDHLRGLALLPAGAIGASGLSGALGVRARLVAWFSGSGAQLAAATSLAIGCAIIAPLAVTPSGTDATNTASPASVTFASTTEPSPTALRSAPDQPASEPDTRQLPQGHQDRSVASGHPPPESASVDATSGTADPSVTTPLETARSAAQADVAPPTTKALTPPSHPIPPVTVAPVTVPPVTVPPVTARRPRRSPSRRSPSPRSPSRRSPSRRSPAAGPAGHGTAGHGPAASPRHRPPVTSVSAPADPLPDIPAVGD